VYIHAADTAYTAPTAKLNGADPAGGWQDLGIVAGSKVNMSYTKETNYIETGIEKVRRGAYITGKTCQLTFDLEQFDMGVIEQISGLSSDVVEDGSSNPIGKAIHIGQEDLVEKALLIIGTNKIDGKEHQYYCKKAALVWAVEEQEDSRILRVTADLYAFTPSQPVAETVDAFVTMYILD
jgi:hypothetical protein